MNDHSRLSAYADDTVRFFADSTPEKVEEVINADLAHVDQWYEQNGMRRKTLQSTKQLLWEKPRLSPSSAAKTLPFQLLKTLKCSELQWTTK